ncbi:2,6-beta-D-fructofuranosidase [Prevotella denticola]|jgi:hypothetical protein|uniref:2,6-beta-D-fructofuranosidase n=1 Tax=Prevotella denticola TaxID=28129 RepID=UPI001C5E0AE7|nr:2,6-beta-D-fructofuranosidase [Prevotella denticola]MBW4760363.1 2,6-beta-D-fructofuranosidase [Prevotella denticola]
MNPNKYIMLALTGLITSVAAVAQDTVKKDSVSNSKEVKNRNVMLNASCADQPRQINVGLPSSLSPTIAEDGVLVSEIYWPVMPYFSWFGGPSLSSVRVLSPGESAVQFGNVTYAIVSKNRYATDKFQGLAGYSVNNYGRQNVDLTITGPVVKGWGYTASIHQVDDPGTHKQSATNDNSLRVQQYKLGISKLFANNKGDMGLLYQFVKYRSTGDSYAPFVFVGDGSVGKYKGFKQGQDQFFPTDFPGLEYVDVITGEKKTRSWGNIGTTYVRQLTFTFNWNFSNRTRLEFASKYKNAYAQMGMMVASGVTPNVAVGTYFHADGSPYAGDVATRYTMYDAGLERSWLTTAVLKGKLADGRHNWRMGLNFWRNHGTIVAQHQLFTHEAAQDPLMLYQHDAAGNPFTFYGFNGGGEYYDGNETKLASFLSDDWNVNKWLYLSAGVRLEYQGYSGKTAMEENGAHPENIRSLNWNLTRGTVTRFTGDWINPAANLNFLVKLLPGFGLKGDYTYNRQRPNLQDYAGAYAPTTKPINVNLITAGVYWNTPWMQLVSQFTYISQTSYKARTQFYHSLASGQEAATVPVTYDIQTIGWTTDAVFTPFKGSMFHALLTLQSPKYKNYTANVTYPSSYNETRSLSDNIVSAMSKVLIELDPSYSIDKWRFWLSFRYFGKQYINLTNTLFYDGHWETFGGVDYKLNRHVNLSLNVVNFLNQLGASGAIGAAALADATEAQNYKNYIMAGSYIRPFELSLGCNINF